MRFNFRRLGVEFERRSWIARVFVRFLAKPATPGAFALFSHVVAGDDIAFADVELAVEDDWVGPARAFAGAGEFEVADFFVGFGIGFYQGHRAVGVVDVEVVVGGDH